MSLSQVIVIKSCFTKDTLTATMKMFFKLHLRTMLHLEEPVNVFLISLFFFLKVKVIAKRAQAIIYIYIYPVPFGKVKAVYFKLLLVIWRSSC